MRTSPVPDASGHLGRERLLTLVDQLIACPEVACPERAPDGRDATVKASEP